MEALQEARDLSKTSFIAHVFSTTEDGKAEILNVVQYALLAIVPIVALNKLIQRFIPEADLDKSALELLVEIFLQIVIMFCGIIVIHRTITFVPTYSGFRYEAFTLTNAVLAFMVLILSIQSKLGIKVNILYDRLLVIWNGPDDSADAKKIHVRNGRYHEGMQTHAPSQADGYMEDQVPNHFPPKPVNTSAPPPPPVHDTMYMRQEPAPANGMLGGSFGSIW